MVLKASLGLFVFKPIEFIEEKQEVIAESVKLGPKPKSKTDSSLKKIDRRTFIDESIMTDYTKIIDKNFTKTFPISILLKKIDSSSAIFPLVTLIGNNLFESLFFNLILAVFS